MTRWSAFQVRERQTPRCALTSSFISARIGGCVTSTWPLLINYTEAFKADYSDSNHLGVLLVIKQRYSSQRHETRLGVSNDISGQAFGQSGKEGGGVGVGRVILPHRLDNVRGTRRTVSVWKLTQGAIHRCFPRQYSASDKSGMAFCDNLSVVTNARCLSAFGSTERETLGHVNRP